MGPNTTGLPQTQDYLLGRGVLYLAVLDTVTLLVKGGWRDVGNVPDFKITAATNTLDHMSSRQGIKQVDRQIVISEEMTMAFGLEEINAENLSAFFFATQLSVTNSAVAGFTSITQCADGQLQLGRWYDLADGSGVRAYMIAAGDLSLITDEGTPVALVQGTDYTVDTVMGRVFILSTSARVATAIAATKGFKATLAAAAGAPAVTEIRAFGGNSILVAAKFVSINENDNSKQTEYEFHKVSLKPTSDFSLISDAATVAQFNCKAERNTAKSPLSPTLTIRTIAGQA